MRRLTIVVLVCFLSAAPLRAQEAVRPLPIKSRAVVFLVDNRGTEHRGRFLRADDQDLLMLVDGDERRFKHDTIARIDRQGDSLKNGAIIGALIGAPIGVIGSLVTGTLGPFLAATGGWIGIGIGLDAAHQGRTQVYSGLTKTTAQGSEGRRTAVEFALRW